MHPNRKLVNNHLKAAKIVDKSAGGDEAGTKGKL